jgi:RNA polymerase sigma factor (sigma-70 family)
MLVVQAQRGDLIALSTLLQRHRARLYAAAIGVLRDREEAADAVQDAFVTALTRISSVNNPAAIHGWMRAVLLNACRMRMRHRRPTPVDSLPDLTYPDPNPEQLLESQTREWIWSCLACLNEEDRLTLLLRHFSRCASYKDIATVTDVPVGTVKSRLHRAHTRLADILQRTETETSHDQHRLESDRRAAWDDFYRVVLRAPEAKTYRSMFDTHVHIHDSGGTWSGIEDWVAEERPAIELGVRATLVGLTAAADLTILEIDFTNPPEAPDHCPARSTFVHRLDHGRTRQLAIHYLR